MAGRGHVDVNERRLRPIYDCLDNCNNKKALQEADKVLKKQRDFPCAKVLKALALLRLGRQDECLAIMHEVHAQSPVDESTLQAMSICYREMNQMDKIADMYENGHKVSPNNEDILTALFMAYVRLGDYKKQQQVAMKLHRLRPPKNPYYFWAVMSIVMQAHFADQKLAQTMFLPLAERMTLKYVEEDKIEAEAEVQMYLIILDLLGKHQVALQAIQSPLGEKLTSEVNYREQLSAELLIKLEKWPEANTAYRNLLTQSPDHWGYYTNYLKALFKMIDANWTPPQDDSSDKPVDHTVDQALAFIQEQIEKTTEEKRPVRGPHLAKIELLKCLIDRQSEEASKIGTPEEVLRQYYRRFGDKSCCFKDVKMYLVLLDAEQLEKVIEELFEESGLAATGDADFPANLKDMHRHLTLTHLARYAGLHYKLPTEDKLKFVDELVRRHQAGLEFGKALLPTEFQFSDPYLLLAVGLLHDLWRDTGDASYVWQAIMLLENGIQASPSSFHFKILLIRLYCVMGVFGPCPALYESMEIKHVQHDAVGYTLSNHISRLGHFTSAYQFYETMLRFFTVNHKETTEYLISSYKIGSFTKIHEFVRFRERLQNSVQYAVGTSERILLDMVLDMDNHQKTEKMLSFMDINPEKDTTAYHELRDNRDFQVLSSCEPADRGLKQEDIDRSFIEEKAWLKLRNLTTRLLAAAVALGRESGGGGGGGGGAGEDGTNHTNHKVNGDSSSSSNLREVLENLASQLQTHLEESALMHSTRVEYPLAGPYRTRLSTYLSLDIGPLLLDMVNCILYIHSLQQDNLGKADESQEEQLQEAFPSKLCDIVQRHKKALITLEDDKHIFHPEVLENLVLLTETISQLTMMAGTCHRMLKPIKSKLLKKGKKKKAATTAVTLPPTFEHYSSLLTGMEKATKDLLDLARDVDPTCLTLDLSQLKLTTPATSQTSDLQSTEAMVWKKVQASYQLSAKEMSELLKSKVQYLQSLKL